MGGHCRLCADELARQAEVRALIQTTGETSDLLLSNSCHLMKFKVGDTERHLRLDTNSDDKCEPGNKKLLIGDLDDIITQRTTML